MTHSEPHPWCTLARPAPLVVRGLVVASLILLANWQTRAQTADVQVGENVVVIEGTLEATPGYLRVHVQLRDGKRVLSGEPAKFSAFKGLQDLSDLDDMLNPGGKREESFTAFLDTGASGHVISRSTVRRFDMEAVPGAVYHETGLHGPTPMDVSRPYAVALGSSNGTLIDESDEFELIHPRATLLINREGASNPLIELAMGEINIIGMPAIRQRVIEIDPSPMTEGAGDMDMSDLEDLMPGLELLSQMGNIGAGPAIRLHGPTYRPKTVDLEVPLTYVNYARLKNPNDRGPMPALSENFVIKNIELQQGDRRTQGDWLFDTGAPASMISKELASQLGLYNEQGIAQRQPDFSLPLGGIGGAVQQAPGYRIERLRIPAADGRIIEYRGAYVIVHDVSTELDNGEHVTLDGIFGTNLLLPTVAGLSFGFPTNVAAGPFRRIWIDGPRRRMLLELEEERGARTSGTN